MRFRGKSRAGDYFISLFVAAGFLFVVSPGNALVLCQKKSFSGAIIGKQKSNQIKKNMCTEEVLLCGSLAFKTKKYVSTLKELDTIR